MAVVEDRASFVSSSFAGPSSPNTILKATKRPLIVPPDLDFFTPAAASFKPRPYTPNPGASISQSRMTHITRVNSRADAVGAPPMANDPSPSDPNVVFLHPPFTSFPNSEQWGEGLSYPVLAQNPEWFLDANDFTSTVSFNSNAIPYPTNLEPPRGWCPARKKDLKDRGVEKWPEGEEPRLRCTFCRRTYSGVNAKSMWRRHVFEKHKIAMSNRRDTADRPRGRGANKENKVFFTRTKETPHDSLVNMDITPQTDPRSTSHSSKFQTVLAIGPPSRRRPPRELLVAPSTPSKSNVPLEEDEVDRGLISMHAQSPALAPSSDSFDADIGSPQSRLTQVPASPYNPLLTPAFRHSSPRLPSEHPWRFNSPSHPLHPFRNLPLSVLGGTSESPATINLKASDTSPAFMRTPQSSSPRPHEFEPAPSDDFDGVESSIGQMSSPNNLLSSGALPLRVIDRVMMRHSSFPESPLARASRSRTLSLRDDWTPVSQATTGLAEEPLAPDRLPLANVHDCWQFNGNDDVSQDAYNSASSSSDADSPVLRSCALPARIGQGTGLMEPFHERYWRATKDDNRYLSEAETDDEAEVFHSLTLFSDQKGSTPPFKRRRTTID